MRLPKNRVFSLSDVCNNLRTSERENPRFLHKAKYGANIRMLLQKYILIYGIHSITSARRSYSRFLRHVVWARLSIAVGLGIKDRRLLLLADAVE